MREHYNSEDVNGKLIMNLRDISHTMRALYEGKGSQKRILMVLNEVGTITQRELTFRLGIQPGSASEVIAKLESAGLLARSSSETDRRTSDISLTEEGKRQAEEAIRQRRQRHEDMFSLLNEEEKVQLLSTLEKINADWEERYGKQRREHCGHHHEHHHDGYHHGEQHHDCNHDCENCPHPCGRGRNR